jgi:hypothetical protein
LMETEMISNDAARIAPGSALVPEHNAIASPKPQ